MTAIVEISATPEHTARRDSIYVGPGAVARRMIGNSRAGCNAARNSIRQRPGAGIGVFSISAPGIPLLVRAETQHPLLRCLAPSEAFQVRRIRDRRRVYPYRVCKTNAAS